MYSLFIDARQKCNCTINIETVSDKNINMKLWTMEYHAANNALVNGKNANLQIIYLIKNKKILKCQWQKYKFVNNWTSCGKQWNSQRQKCKSVNNVFIDVRQKMKFANKTRYQCNKQRQKCKFHNKFNIARQKCNYTKNIETVSDKNINL